MFHRVDSALGQFEIIGAAIQAAGAIGGAFITADATKYAAKQQAKAMLMVELARQKAELEAQRAQLEASSVAQIQETERTQASSKTITFAIVAFTFVALAGAAAYVASQD